MNLYRVHEPLNAWPTVEWNDDIPDMLCGDVRWYHEGETVSLACKHFALGGKPLMMTHDGYYVRIPLRHMTAFTVMDGETVEDAYQRMLTMLQHGHGKTKKGAK